MVSKEGYLLMKVKTLFINIKRITNWKSKIMNLVYNNKNKIRRRKMNLLNKKEK